MIVTLSLARCFSSLFFSLYTHTFIYTYYYYYCMLYFPVLPAPALARRVPLAIRHNSFLNLFSPHSALSLCFPCFSSIRTQDEASSRVSRIGAEDEASSRLYRIGAEDEASSRLYRIGTQASTSFSCTGPLILSLQWLQCCWLRRCSQIQLPWHSLQVTCSCRCSQMLMPLHSLH